MGKAHGQLQNDCPWLVSTRFALVSPAPPRYGQLWVHTRAPEVAYIAEGATYAPTAAHAVGYIFSPAPWADFINELL